MQSTLAWLDHSEQQQKQMMEVVGLFREKTTVDDLGLGSIRDTFSDLLFPGTSTLHTRARYLVFIPWICRRLEEASTPSRRAPDRFRELEVHLIEALLRGGADNGVIGKEARANLKQFPSFMYWSSLRSNGILTVPMTRGQYLANLDGFHLQQRRYLKDPADEGGEIPPHNWHLGLPAEPDDDFLESATMELDPEEAAYLTDRMLTSAPTSLLAQLLNAPPAEDVATPWSHPEVGSLPPETAEVVHHAHMFSAIMHGAALLYNLLLAEAVRDRRTAGDTLVIDEDLTTHYRDELAAWAQCMDEPALARTNWDRVEFWELVLGANPRVPTGTRRFVDLWRRAVERHGMDGVVDDRGARELVRRRELSMKGGLARLHNPRALERWTGAAGSDALDFRWATVDPIIREIVAARSDHDA